MTHEPFTPASSDPWETPPVQIDPELVKTSLRLMAKSIPPPKPDHPLGDAPDNPDPAATTDPKDLQIAQLEEEKQRLFQRNVFLVTETTRLRVENQYLSKQLLELKQHSQNWLTRFLHRLRQPQ